MELILQRISPTIIFWTLIALLGLGISVATFFLLRKNLHIQKKMRQPVEEIIKMLEHNMFAEVIRGSAQITALVISVGFLADWLPAQAIGWALVIMNISVVIASINEFVTAIRILKED